MIQGDCIGDEMSFSPDQPFILHQNDTERPQTELACNVSFKSDTIFSFFFFLGPKLPLALITTKDVQDCGYWVKSSTDRGIILILISTQKIIVNWALRPARTK